MENLSNELFYEIFDYLNGIAIYNAFSNLNHRFQHLLHSSSFPLKIKLHYSTTVDEFMNTYEQIFLHNRHQIYSIHSSTSEKNNWTVSSFNIDSSFIRLESLVFDSIKPDVLISLLSHLTCLPRLFSLTIYAPSPFKELNDVYQLLFALPKLRYAECLASNYGDSDVTISLPLAATNKQFSTIEHLVISHSCTFKELFAIISYTPQLRRLKFNHLSDNDSSISMISPITLSHLTYISIYGHDITFDQFEIFITKIDCKLKVLRVTSLSEDMTYLDANRWERLILQYIPQLEKFYLEYNVHFEDDDYPPMYLGEPNQFTSSFWFERQWIFNAYIDYDSIEYSIRPYKKKWYEYRHDKLVNSSSEFCKSARLMFMNVPSKSVNLLNMNISRVLDVAHVYHCFIFENIFVGRLSEVLFPLRKIDSLQMSSLSLSEPRRLSEGEATVLAWISTKNQITKVNLEKMNDVEEVNFLIELCPRMTYLKVNCINNMDIELFVRGVLLKVISICNHHLRLLCFRIPAGDDKMVKKLEKMINSEQLLADYTIKRILDNIHLEWK